MSSPPPVGQLHGPGNVGSFPGYILHAGSWVSPPADRDAAEDSGPRAFGIAGRKAGLKAEDDPGMSEDTLKFFVAGMLSGNALLQRYIVDNYTLPNVEFVHIQGSTRGRENYYNTFRGATGLMDYKAVAVRDVIMTEDKACVWLDLKIKARSMLPAIRRNFPCLVWFVFKVDPEDGRKKVALQHDHHSFFAITWMGGVWAAWLHECILRPVMGWSIIWQGIFYDHVKALLSTLSLSLGMEPLKLEQDSDLAACVEPLYRRGTASSKQLTPREMDKCAREAVLRLGEQGMLVGHRSIADLEVWPGHGWLTQLLNALIGLLGIPSFMVMMTIGAVFAFFGPFPHVFP